MKTRDLFGLAIRLIGLAFLYQSLSAVPMAVAAVCPRFPHFVFSNLFAALLMVGWPFLVAYWLIRGAPPLMRLAYPDEKSTGADEIANPRSPLPQ